MNFETNKNLGGVGAILMFAGIFPYISAYGITELAGAILLLISLKGFADYYREAGIFNNALYAIISGIVGVAAFVAIAVVAFIDFFTELGITLTAGTAADWTMQFSQIDWQSIGINVFVRFAGFIFLDIIVLLVFMIITAILLRKSLKLLSAKTGIGLFGTTGTVLLIGAALVIIFGLGLLLVWISTLLLAIAFFQMRPPTPETQLPPQNPTYA